MTFNDQKIEKEIERYYFLSKLINKYGKIFLMLTLSFLYILFNNTDFDVFAFTSNKLKEMSLVDIHGENINVKGIIFDEENISMINDSLGLSGIEFKVIGSDITYKDVILSNKAGKRKKIKKLSYNVGLVKTKDDVVLPIKLSQPIYNIYRINTADEEKKYIEYHNLIVKDALNKGTNKLKAKNNNPESLESLYKLYNTYCMKDSIFKVTSYFCDRNVESMMNNLHRHNMEKDDYRKLFNAFAKNMDNDTLCKKAVTIAEYQTNFENIKGMVHIYCDEETKANFKMAEDVYRLAYTNTSSSNITNDDVRKMYFMEMERKIYKKSTLAIEDITAYLENIQSIVRHRPAMFKNDTIFSDKLAYFIKDKLLIEIKDKLDKNESNVKKIDKLISTIINGDDLQGNMLGLIAYTSDWNENSALASANGQHGSANSVMSFKEKTTLFLNNNIKYFEKISFEVDTKRKLALVNGVLKITLEDGGKVDNRNIRTTLIVRENELKEISIVRVKLDDDDLEGYMKSLNIDVKGKSLKLIQDIYSDKLIYPLVYNNYGDSIVTACVNISGCKNNQISTSIRGTSEISTYDIKVVYTIDNDGKLLSIEIKDKEFVISDKEEIYNIEFNLSSVEPKLNKIIKIKDLKYSDVGTIENRIMALINDKILKVLKKDELGIDIINKLKDNFVKYLNVRPTDYRKTKLENIALVGFTLNGIRFNSFINIKTNEIIKLFLYDTSKKTNILIKNTNLKFSSAYVESLTLLKLDTKGFIKETDIEVYNTYIDIQK